MGVMWSREQAIELCTAIEVVVPEHGAHVALTGGCLYKKGERKDIDLLFYCIRQRDRIDEEGVLNALRKLGFVIGKHHGWVFKAKFEGKDVDLFFPEAYPAQAEGEDRPYP